jgi:hypothetical protein
MVDTVATFVVILYKVYNIVGCTKEMWNCLQNYLFAEGYNFIKVST